MDKEFNTTEMNDSTRLYLRQINQIKLLTIEEERVLGERIAAGDLDAVTELAERNLKLVVSIARRYANYGIPLLDIIQEGNIGLIKAAEKFDISAGCRFATFAPWWIRQSITKAIIEQSRTIRLPANILNLITKIKKAIAAQISETGATPSTAELAKILQVDEKKIEQAMELSTSVVSFDMPIGEEEDSTLEEIIADERVEPHDSDILKEDRAENVEKILNTLTDREAKIIKMRFGLGEAKRQHTLEEIGKALNLSRERIRQLEIKALGKLRNPIRANKIKELLA